MQNRNHAKRTIFVPVTPAGTYLMHLDSGTEAEAIEKLLHEASHMPYNGWVGFKKRGYRITQLVEV